MNHDAQLIGHIYDAAHGVIDWRELGKPFARLLDGTTVITVVEDRRSSAIEPLINHAIPVEAMAEYAERYAPYDLWVNNIRSRQLLGRPVLGQEIVPTETYEKSIIYNELSRKYDAGLHALVATLRFPEFDIIFGTHRRSMREPFDRQHADVLGTILPHLANAIAGRQLVGESTLAGRASHAFLDVLDKGIVHINSDGRMLYANKAAEHVFRLNDGLRCIGNRLRATGQADNEGLQRLIAAATKATPDRGHRAGGYLRISRVDADSFYVIRAVPLEVDLVSGKLRTAAACLIISCSEGRVGITNEALVSIFGFTAAEARVATALANGSTLHDAAKRLSITYNTARTLLARSLDKSSTSSQASLVRLILSCIVMM
jgi:PAS domain-containing protein/DNA-binding CsgD family transcriptional regulator